MKQSLRFRPLEARCRVIVIRDAQNMKVEAANALLKVLEEPPADNLFILAAFDGTGLLPTILSRCLHLPFQPLPSSDIASHLSKIHSVDPDQSKVVASMAGGSLSRAIALLDEEQLTRRRWLLEIVAKLHKSKPSEVLIAAQMWRGENSNLKQDLEWLKTWVRDLLIQGYGKVASGGLLNSDFAEELAETAPLMRSKHLLEAFELLCTLQRAISYNINKRLTLEALLLYLRDLTVGGGTVSDTIHHAVGKEPLAFKVSGWL